MVNANPCARPEFIWRFYSCQKRHYHFVIAPTEDEARGCPLYFLCPFFH